VLDSSLLGSAGKYSLVVRYDGSATYAPSQTSVTLTVTKAPKRG
jgi:hypothetical protein